MPHDLDAEWRAENPQPTLDDLKLTWAGQQLIRLEEVPIEALRFFDEAVNASDSGIDQIVHAIRLSLHPDCHPAFNAVVESISIHRLMMLWRRLTELSAGRPTAPASDSGTGRGDNGTTSTETSSASVELPLRRSGIAPSSTLPTPPAPSTP